MLEIKNIFKVYVSGEQETKALDNVSINFRESEFVSILGPSGSGKTTLLNIISGLDRYSSGDLCIQGVSTKLFKDNQWDAYRNSIVGFVFQNYNLIAHLSVLENVEIALKLTGMSKKERVEKAKEAIREVDLEDQLSKRPNQLSGGQMQRVAIARALVNNPKIVLADEPTGALDSKNSEQIMELLRKISKDRLVIMVTHNEDLALTYSSRIIRFLDGKIQTDTNPVTLATTEKTFFKDRTAMPLRLAMQLSFRNLLTKKGRTILTSIVGSIGIIGIALVLALSNGLQAYLGQMQVDTLSSMPISINEQARQNGPSGRPPILNGATDEATEVNQTIQAMGDASERVHSNKIDNNFIEYLSNMDPNIYEVIKKNYPAETIWLYQDNTEIKNLTSNSINLQVIPNNSTYLAENYTLITGEYPVDESEAMIIVNNENAVNPILLEQLNLPKEFEATELIGKTFYVLNNDQFYYEENGEFKGKTFADVSNSNFRKVIISSVIKEKSTSTMRGAPDSTGIGYFQDAIESIYQENKDSEVVKKQKDADVNVLTGQVIMPIYNFQAHTTVSIEEQKEEMLARLGDNEIPTSIQIYPKSFEGKNQILKYLDAYNNGKENADTIIYTDMTGAITDTLTTLIDTITIVLIVFASVSLLVSSVMIGIITYISVFERTKEIGILRSIGARKKDISRIFNAEAILIGLFSGVFGVVVTMGLTVIANVVIVQLLPSLPITLQLRLDHAAYLIILSLFLTFIASFIPAKVASNKNPVEALRTE